MVIGFYNYSNAGSPDQQVIKGKHDYFDFPVSFGARPFAPQSFEGMSGGGLWQVPLSKNDQGEIIHKPSLLSDVVFYQVPSTETQCGVKCHGRPSLYNVAYEALENKLP